MAGLVGHGFIEDRQRQVALQGAVHVIDLIAEVFNAADQALGGFIDLAAFLGQGKAGAAAVTQGHAQPQLQILQVTADGGAANIQLQLGGGQATTAGNRHKNAQQADIGVRQVSQQGFHGCLPIVS